MAAAPSRWVAMMQGRSAGSQRSTSNAGRSHTFAVVINELTKGLRVGQAALSRQEDVIVVPGNAVAATPLSRKERSGEI